MIGADSLEYLPLDALSRICAGCACGLCDACFSGRYPVDISVVQLKSQFEEEISSD
jgi:amidophosphoribosyltransferase